MSPPFDADGLELSARLEPDFHHVHADARIGVSFTRTLRVPDDGCAGTVPAGLDRLPMARVRDLRGTMPDDWERAQGIVLPVYQSEAVRVLLDSPLGYPWAVKVLADARNALTGRPWQPKLVRRPPNYIMVPCRNHLDRVPGMDGRPKQIVARPLHEADTSRGPVFDAAAIRSLHIAVTPLAADRWRRGRRATGLSDPYGLDDWDERHTQTCVVRLVQAQRWREVSGQSVPHAPISRDLYSGARVPWLESYRVDHEVPNRGRRLGVLDEPEWDRSA